MLPLGTDTFPATVTRGGSIAETSLKRPLGKDGRPALHRCTAGGGRSHPGTRLACPLSAVLCPQSDDPQQR